MKLSLFRHHSPTILSTAITEFMEGKGSSSSSESGTSLQHDWVDLTHECLITILSRLSLEQRWRGPMLVCKSWLQACRDPCLNSVFDLEPHFDSLTELPRYWTPEFERKIDSMLRSTVDWSDGSLTEIRVRHCSDRSLSFVAGRCPSLRVLSIKSSPHATDHAMAKIAFDCSNLRELDISFCYEISHQSLALIGKQCPNLRILKRNLMNWLESSQHVGVVPHEYIDACPQDGDSDAVAIGKYMQGLLHLELRFSKITVKGLLVLSEGCRNLEYLDICGCANLTSRDIATATSNMKNLITIKKPNYYIPRSVFHAERYGHWRLYDERFQTDVFRI